MADRDIPAKHIRVIGTVALLWSGAGAIHYILTFIGSSVFKDWLGPFQQDGFERLPDWYMFTWTVLIWCGVSGSLLLLLRKKISVALFAITFGSLVINLINNVRLGAAGTMQDAHPMRWIAILLYIAFFLFLTIYTWRLSRSDLLR